MKVAVFGAGAIGAVLAARFAAAGQNVAVIARGKHLEAIRERGLRVRSEVFGVLDSRPRASDNPAEIGPVDVVFLTVKAHALPAIAPALAPLFHGDTMVVTLQNGLPWWYFHGVGEPWEGTRLETVDPGGVIARHIEIRRVIGGLAYCSSSLVAPGVVDHLEGIRFPLGEPLGGRSERILALAKAFTEAGFKCSVRADMRREIWAKLMGNAAFNPVSALTRTTMEQMLRLPRACELAASIMKEVLAVAAAVGVDPGLSPEKRIAGAQKVGPHKTSMLQDLEAGRPPELEPIVGAIVELAEKAGVAVPSLLAVYACAELLFAQQAANR